MLLDEIRTLMQSNPFRPFTVHVSDGSAVLVHHHDYAWVLPTGYQLFVQTKEGRVHHISVPQITQISYPMSAELEIAGTAAR